MTAAGSPPPRDNADVLAMCLQAIAEGRATPEQCVASFPEHAAELRVLLRTAADLGQVRRPVLPAERVAAIGAVLQAAAMPRQLRKTMQARTAGRGVLRWALTLGLVFAMLLASGVGTVAASNQSLPGETLYPVKRFSEDVRLQLASEQQKANLLVDFAQERIEEAEELLASGQMLDAEVVGDLLAASDIALQSLENAPDNASPELAEQLVEVSARQEVVLTGVLASAPPAAQSGLQRALEASQHGQQRAQAVLAGEKETGPPDHAGPPDGDGPPGQEDKDNGNSGGDNGQGPPCETPPCSNNNNGQNNSSGKGQGNGGS